ncbi:MAG: hypothetical protein JWQ19_1609 [Subtercola sp.]|nr:hypothetical protein [Subtercola sp.]
MITGDAIGFVIGAVEERLQFDLRERTLAWVVLGFLDVRGSVPLEAHLHRVRAEQIKADQVPAVSRVADVVAE